jgi:hypothetical protein
MMGPAALRVSHVRYNKVIQETKKEQLLLNLVRLRYREEPLFLDVGSVAAQFSLRESADAAATINEGPTRINPDRLVLSTGVGFEERPTITFVPLQGKDFAARLLTPLKPDVVVLLSRSGWSIDRVMRLTIQTLNGLSNAPGASGPTPKHPPRYQEFAAVSKLFRALQERGLLEMGYEVRHSEVSAPIAAGKIGLSDVIEAAQQGYRLVPGEDGRSLVLTDSSSVLVWRIPPAAAETAEVREIVRLLGLVPDRQTYEIRLGAADLVRPQDETGRRSEITIATRSLMGTLFYLSQSVDVPKRHRDKGFVTTTTDAEGRPFDWSLVTGDLLRVRSRRAPPRSAAVAVRHWGHWYYVDNADLTSKSTLALLGQLFALQAGAAESTAPVLTLPVGG